MRINNILNKIIVIFSVISCTTIVTHASNLENENDLSTTTIDVKVSLVSSCKIQTRDINFLEYNGERREVQGDVSVTCTRNASYSIGIDKGEYGESPERRKMKQIGGKDTLNYEIRKDSSNGEIWGDTKGKMVNGKGDGTRQNYNLFAILPENQVANEGQYSDRVTLKISFSN